MSTLDTYSPQDLKLVPSEATQQEDLPCFVSLFETPDESVCEFGDVVLIADDGFHPQLKIRCSSCILRSSSKVFRILLGPRFAEGQALRSGTNELTLADDPRALLLLCQMLHRQTQPPHIALDSNILLDFALTVDKYDCVQTLHDSIYVYFEGVVELNEDSTIRRIRDALITASFVLDQPKLFRRQTRALVLEETLSIWSPGDRCRQLLPDGLLASLRTQQDYIQRELTLAITRIMDTFCTAAYRASKPNLVEVFLQELRVRMLWPLDFRYAQLDAFVAELRTVKVSTIRADQDEPFKAPTYARKTRYVDNGGWGAPSELEQYWEPDPEDQPFAYPEPLDGLEIPNQRHLEEAAARVEKLCVGLCLDCLKGKDVCRVAHVKAWHIIQPKSEFRICGDCGSALHNLWDGGGPCPGMTLPPGWEASW